jgi:beta-lactamase regulating signal transducer with metallopeptidase domain
MGIILVGIILTAKKQNANTGADVNTDTNTKTGVNTDINVNTDIDKNENTYSHERTLKDIAKAILIVGILGGVVLLICSIVKEEFIYFITALAETGSCIITWTIFNVLSNISINLFKIKDALESK